MWNINNKGCNYDKYDVTVVFEVINNSFFENMEWYYKFYEIETDWIELFRKEVYQLSTEDQIEFARMLMKRKDFPFDF